MGAWIMDCDGFSGFSALGRGCGGLDLSVMLLVCWSNSVRTDKSFLI